MQIVIMLECCFSVIKSVATLHKNNTQSKHLLSRRLSSGVRGKVTFHYPSAKSSQISSKLICNHLLSIPTYKMQLYDIKQLSKLNWKGKLEVFFVGDVPVSK